ncbi:hypothetical protein V2W30_04915 [Streptomyces sp. Q6]|uniref:Uncharacterized protein n=1 Tax=Streptomyces citrinus TaxID=3118173 RepID=A0ACD5A6D5_9ACTN
MDRVSPEMADEVRLTVDEYAAVHTAVRSALGPAWTLNSLFEAWGALVADVEEGYGWSAPELANDLECRTALARIWRLLPPRVRAIRQPELDGIDERFRSSTVGWPGQGDRGLRWWLHRVPRQIEAEIPDLNAQGWPMGWDVLPFPRPGAVEITGTGKTCQVDGLNAELG